MTQPEAANCRGREILTGTRRHQINLVTHERIAAPIVYGMVKAIAGMHSNLRGAPSFSNSDFGGLKTHPPLSAFANFAFFAANYPVPNLLWLWLRRARKGDIFSTASPTRSFCSHHFLRQSCLALFLKKLRKGGTRRDIA